MPLICQLCNSFLSEDTKSGQLLFVCKICFSVIQATDEQTLVFEDENDRTYESDIISNVDIMSNEILNRIKIKCNNCESKVANVMITKNGKILKACLGCSKSDFEIIRD